ncbi:MAG: arginine--tRNA ligase [Coriobacteriia bacterium]|nr:arginine--tRNA ligase [Coriobacteriia bacterium]
MRQQIDTLVRQTLAEMISDGSLPPVELPPELVERPRQKNHGDWACTAALKLSKTMGINPQDLAARLASRLADDERIAGVEVAGPGFINLTLADAAWQEVIAEVVGQGGGFARAAAGAGRRVNVEFISANPTGPMHVGHGRWAALGNALCNLLEHAGWQVTREFYINDAGHQMDVFANSVLLRYLEILGQPLAEPEEFYGGGYVADIARQIYEEEGDAWLEAADSSQADARLEHFRERAYRLMLAQMQELCQRIDVPFDIWFSERTLYEPDQTGLIPINKMLDRLDGLGYLYEKDGATWFRSTDFGDDKDRVLVKSDGSYTYFCPDIAYHLVKLERPGLESASLVNIWGADHHGYVARMQAALAACGHADSLTVLLGQLVTLLRGGSVVRMSKRSGEMVSFQELVDEVGADATKYLMLGRATDQPIDFDIEAAKQADNSNPVYYVQYAHARICSLFRKAEERGISASADDLGLLVDSSELELARIFSRLPELIEDAARDLAPYRLTHYAEELATALHSFYTRCPVLTAEPRLAAARLYLSQATRSVLVLVLGLLGVSAPERM